MCRKLPMIIFMLFATTAQAGVVISPDGKVSTVITSNYNNPQSCEPSREQIMLDRIAILQKAENSTDPDILAMAEQVRSDIAKDKLQLQEKQNNPALYWFKKLIPLFASFAVFGGLLYAVFWFVEKRNTKTQ